MRPASHREQIPEKRCGNCQFAKSVKHGLFLLCFHGDSIEVQDEGRMFQDVVLDGSCVSLMDGEEFDDVWAGRDTDGTDVCDEWKEESPK